jgi:hypothetical protein
VTTPAAVRPAAHEHAPYYGTYISKVADGDIRETLRRQGVAAHAFFAAIPESQGEFAYGPGKWTLKESLLHVTDAERVFTYRMLRIARADPTPMPGFDQDVWVPNCEVAGRSVQSLTAEFAAVRAATQTLVDSLSDAAWSRTGTASEKTVSARALAWVIAGHMEHHLAIFREKYLG